MDDRRDGSRECAGRVIVGVDGSLGSLAIVGAAGPALVNVGLDELLDA